jgi:zinc finger MYND domain-containing protein 10
LCKYSIYDIGGLKWFEQQGWVEKLNLQSHAHASLHVDDFIQDYLVSFSKIGTILHELLLMEVWKQHVLPLLKEHLVMKLDSITTYLLLFYEANLANLLELVLFNEQALEQLNDEELIELADWCMRRLQYLNTQAHDDARPIELSAKVSPSSSRVKECQDSFVHMPPDDFHVVDGRSHFESTYYLMGSAGDARAIRI